MSQILDCCCSTSRALSTSFYRSRLFFLAQLYKQFTLLSKHARDDVMDTESISLCVNLLYTVDIK